jgi:SAM-dependent methyltransferase
MANLDHTAGRSAFGGDAAGYQSARPPYPDWVFAHLTELCGAPPGETFEIGPGTGQATRRLLSMGARVTAVEPDARLAAHLQALNAPELRVRVETFEAAELPPAAFDLGLAATSFHWLEQAPALAKVGRLLRPGGVWAAIANVFGDSDLPDAFHDATQALLGALPMGPAGSGRARPYALDTDARLADLRASGVFGEFVAERRNRTLVLDTAGVRALYGTYSHITTLPEAEHEQILDALAEIAERQFSGRVERNMVTTLLAARRL